MKSYTQYISELEEEKPVLSSDLLSFIESEYRKHFPNGFIIVKKAPMTKDDSRKHISIGLVSEQQALSNGIRENDPMMATFSLEVGRDGETFLFERFRGNGLKINPAGRMAFDSVKVAFRKVKGNEQRVRKAWSTHIKRLADAVKTNSDNIYGAKSDSKFVKTVK